MSRDVIIECIETGPLSVNTYAVYIKGADSCIVIDPADADAVSGYVKSRGMSIAAVLLTHCHFDHILGVPGLHQGGAKLYIGEKDAPGLNDRNINLTFMNLSVMKPDVLLRDGDRVEEAGLCFDVLFTPGHTAGGVCYVLKESGAIFAGDTLFRLSIGRTDLPGGSYSELISSIKDRLFTLDGDYTVLPGHGEATSLDEERQRNPYAGRGARW